MGSHTAYRVCVKTIIKVFLCLKFCWTGCSVSKTLCRCYAHPVNRMGSHNVYCAPIVPSTGEYWREDGLEKTEIFSHTRLLMIVRYCCVLTGKYHFILSEHNGTSSINTLNAELNPICYLLALLGVHFLHVSRKRVKSLTLRLLMSLYIYIYIYIYIYGAPILDVSRSHTTTHHSR